MKFVKAVKNDSSVVRAVQATEDNITEIYSYLSTGLGCEVSHYYKDPNSGLQFVFFKVPANFTCYDVIGVGDWLVIDADSWYAANDKAFSRSYRLEKDEEFNMGRIRMDLEDRINELERHIEIIKDAGMRSDKIFSNLTTIIFIGALITMAIIYFTGC